MLQTETIRGGDLSTLRSIAQELGVEDEQHSKEDLETFRRRLLYVWRQKLERELKSIDNQEIKKMTPLVQPDEPFISVCFHNIPYHLQWKVEDESLRLIDKVMDDVLDRRARDARRRASDGDTKKIEEFRPAKRPRGTDFHTDFAVDCTPYEDLKMLADPSTRNRSEEGIYDEYLDLVPSYDKIPTTLKPIGSTEQASIMMSRNKCWNCESTDHNLRECREPRNQAAIARNRLEFLESKLAEERYYEEKKGQQTDILSIDDIDIYLSSVEILIHQKRCHSLTPIRPRLTRDEQVKKGAAGLDILEEEKDYKEQEERLEREEKERARLMEELPYANGNRWEEKERIFQYFSLEIPRGIGKRGETTLLVTIHYQQQPQEMNYPMQYPLSQYSAQETVQYQSWLGNPQYYGGSYANVQASAPVLYPPTYQQVQAERTNNTTLEEMIEETIAEGMIEETTAEGMIEETIEETTAEEKTLEEKTLEETTAERITEETRGERSMT
ncbi:hypothetical protein PROFUN_14816 [Planoprotostelium fungivorum]|uniref:CCHC-type domain-containing protein n=1 Tax=Planoprotostelium fungivorum TaxID=1890364 RepID=A0A2P6MYC7_9EUKA|nr:hypothetical protein PROFUN_14816 [Planoprotostelium fungivorum]